MESKTGILKWLLFYPDTKIVSIFFFPLLLKFSASISGSKKISLKPKNVRSSAYVKRLKVALTKQKVNSNSAHQRTPLSAPQRKTKERASIASDARQRLESARFRYFLLLLTIFQPIITFNFRYLNEELYTKSSSEAWELFQEDPQSFDIYHKGFKNQVLKWPVNPLDIIITDLMKG